MTQTALDFTRPRPGDLFKHGTQCYRLYERLLEGPVTNHEVVEGMKIYNSTGRASTVRAKIKPYCMTLEAKRVRDGLFVYSLRG